MAHSPDYTHSFSLSLAFLLPSSYHVVVLKRMRGHPNSRQQRRDTIDEKEDIRIRDEREGKNRPNLLAKGDRERTEEEKEQRLITRIQ